MGTVISTYADRGPRLRVLAVDDDPALATLVAVLLRPDGHAVVTANSGEEAAERLARDRFDLVISDLGLGTGMTGWELAEHVRAVHAGTPFILVTGWGAAIDPAEARARGVDAVIAKPFRAAQLRAAVADVRGQMAEPVDTSIPIDSIPA